ncbi:hypothetical protein BGX28_001099 [Mortierella sp. GBA30]|nr:hypothetical protein BGX28_001099 [Mortierella sp. GBA30]
MIRLVKWNAKQATKTKESQVGSRSLAGRTNQPPPSNTGQSTTAANMRQFMSVISPKLRNVTPATGPSLTQVDGVPWLTFNYSAKSINNSYTIRVDIDTVDVELIPPEMRQANCLYPSANGPEQEYKGTRRDYERECNEQGWKLAFMNPSILNGKKGVLQCAVINLRNGTSEQKSRRAKRQEKAAVQTAVQQQERRQGQVVAIPRINRPQLSRVPGQNIESYGHVRAIPSIQWHMPQISTMRQSSQQRPSPVDLIVGDTKSNASICNSSNNLETRPVESQVDASEPEDPEHRPPSLGVFTSAPCVHLEFDGYIHGQAKKLHILTSIEQVQLEDLSYDFKKENCVYPRSFSTNEEEPNAWNNIGIRQAEESYLNEIGWKLCSLNKTLLCGRRLLLQQALNAYRRRFLPTTCQPRARIGPSLLIRSTSVSDAATGIGTSGRTDAPHIHHRSNHSRVRFNIRGSSPRKSIGRPSGYTEDDTNEDSPLERSPSRDRVVEEGEVEEEEEEDEDAEEDSSDNESEDGSSSEEVFHSQMSLLSFAGNIQTYSLGTGSGSARSRPRISSLAAQEMRPLPSTSAARKHSLTDKETEHSLQAQAQVGKRARHESVGLSTRLDSLGQTGGDEDEAANVANQNYNDDDDEEDWWMSRLNNSEYPEDHNFISMTTEELIGALTSGYNSDVEDEDEDGDEDDLEDDIF